MDIWQKHILPFWSRLVTATDGDSEIEAVPDIYREYILPIIEGCKKDDELLFVTPSTFFGFYSVGARTFEQVCESLRDAKDRGVRLQILVDVGDVLTATAAQGLLRFLREGEELRDMQGNPATYFLLHCRKEGESVFVEFKTDIEQPMKYLPDVRFRRFGGLLRPPLTLSLEDARIPHSHFDVLWDPADKSVRDSIARYMPLFYLKRRFDSIQLTALAASFASGSLLGILATISFYENFSSSWWVILLYVAGTLTLGVIGSFIGSFVGSFTRHAFGRG